MSTFGIVYNYYDTPVENITDNINYSESVINLPAEHINSFMELCYIKRRVISPFDYIYSGGVLTLCHIMSYCI